MNHPTSPALRMANTSLNPNSRHPLLHQQLPPFVSTSRHTFLLIGSTMVKFGSKVSDLEFFAVNSTVIASIFCSQILPLNSDGVYSLLSHTYGGWCLAFCSCRIWVWGALRAWPMVGVMLAIAVMCWLAVVAWWKRLFGGWLVLGRDFGWWDWENCWLVMGGRSESVGQ